MTKLPDLAIERIINDLDGLYFRRQDMPWDTYFHLGVIEVHEQDRDGGDLGLVGKFEMIEHEWKWVPA